MSPAREADITASFVTLATALATGADVVDLLADLTADCARLLDVASAGLLLADGLGTLHVMAASSEITRDLEVFQTQRDQGPCLDCYHSGRAVSVPDLHAAQQRWPAFTAVALGKGFASVHAVPMRLRERTLGALGLFGTQVGDLNADDLSLGQALADVASVAIVQNARSARAHEPAAGPVAGLGVVTDQLQAALASRMVVEQAKGVLAHAGEMGMEAAFVLLRSYARAEGRRLSEVALDVVERRLPAQVVMQRAAADADADAR